MNPIISLLLFFAFPLASVPVAAQPSGEFRNRLAAIAEGSEVLWGIRFMPNVAVIYPSTGQMALYRRSGGEILRDSTTWDRDIPVANSTTTYKGVRYLTLVGDWMVGTSPAHKLELTAHESFHAYQDSLGISPVSSENAHLDSPEGRALLHMEFDALRKALSGNRKAIGKALAIREARRRMFPANNEAAFELHEGLAQYTGIRIARSAGQEAEEYAKEALCFNNERGYTNSFAYATGPAYALLLDRYVPGWRNRASESTGLSELLAEVFPAASRSRRITEQERYLRLLEAELLQSDDPSEYEAWLTNDTNVLRIPNDGINIVFNPNDRITAIGDQAVLLRNVTLRGAWGTLTVRRGIVRMNDWSQFLLAAPVDSSGNQVLGPEYLLNLTDGWKIVRSEKGWQLNRSKK